MAGYDLPPQEVQLTRIADYMSLEDYWRRIIREDTLGEHLLDSLDRALLHAGELETGASDPLAQLAGLDRFLKGGRAEAAFLRPVLGSLSYVLRGPKPADGDEGKGEDEDAPAPEPLTPLQARAEAIRVREGYVDCWDGVCSYWTLRRQLGHAAAYALTETLRHRADAAKAGVDRAMLAEAARTGHTYTVTACGDGVPYAMVDSPEDMDFIWQTLMLHCPRPEDMFLRLCRENRRPEELSLGYVMDALVRRTYP